MGRCCVPGCRGNYQNGPKVRVYCFPRDEVRRKAWLRAIPRKDFTPTEHSRVCELHFHAGDFITTLSHQDELTGKIIEVKRDRLQLKIDAAPSVFPNCPKYLSSTPGRSESPETKKARRENAALQEAMRKSLQSNELEQKRNKVSSYEEFKSKLPGICNTKFWTVSVDEQCVRFLLIENDPSPNVKCALVVLPDLSLSVFLNGVKLLSLPSGRILPAQVCDTSSLSLLLEELEIGLHNIPEVTKESKHTKVLQFVGSLLADLIEDSDTTKEQSSLLKFLVEQIELLLAKQHVYSAELLVFASILNSISPHAYHFTRAASRIILPHPSTLRRVCSNYKADPLVEQNQPHCLSYIRERVKSMKDHEKTVTLMIDEIHIKPYFDYKGGTIVGSSVHSTEPATTAHVFMVQSLLSANKDVIHILPVSKLSAEILHEHAKNIIINVEKMGLKIIAVITDNNALNRKMMSLFATSPQVSIVYPHPADNARPLFYVVDPVHLLKCIRNNWINQKNPGTCLYFPEMDLSGAMPEGPPRMKAASFAAVRQLYSSEKTSLVKAAYRLNAKAVNPTSMERQNVKLALDVINQFVSNALRTHGSAFKIPQAESTALFIDVILTWWQIVNVKTPCKGQRLRDSMQDPVRSVDDTQLAFLSGVVDWLDAWARINITSGSLTKETHSALRLTCYSLVELSRYCLEELHFKYVLLGKFQTDALEDRFGRYRQLAGSQYHISVRQLYECEKKLRLQKLLTFPREETEFEDVSEDLVPCNFSVAVSDDDITHAHSDMDAIVYIAGYAAHAALKKLSCSACFSTLVIENREIEAENTAMIANLSRGGLKFPQPCTVHMVLMTKLVAEKLSFGATAEDFLSCRNQRGVVISQTISLLDEHDIETCENGHTAQTLLRLVVRVATNVVLNNFCKLRNDAIQDNAQQKAAARKAATLKKK
ncbi:uncharacterized protein LOC144094883 [Amblyomma americanum]